jgi:superfamily II DNA/RNA helicase
MFVDSSTPPADDRELPPAQLPAAKTPPGAAFAALGLASEIVHAIGRAGYTAPTEVQARAVPEALTGQDLLVTSQTGSGKTAAFVWPALQRVLDARRDPTKSRAKGAPRGPRVLVLAPTRELAMQVSRACDTYGRGVQGLRVAHVVGGVPYHAQLKALRGPLDLLICTPGRLLDLMNSGAAVLAGVELLVLDEADRMLDMGFIDDISTIARALPATRQTMMFSATFAGEVGALAAALTRSPRRIRVDAHTDTHAGIEQRLHWADSRQHKQAMLEQLLTDRDMKQCLVFTSTQQDADVLAGQLGEIGHSVAALHGGMPQGRRNRVLQGLRQGHLRVLVATDVAARGIDVPTISHVINWGLPMKAEDYVHRIGRTGRAGRNGLAITLAERRDVGMIRRIERFTTQPIATAVVAGYEPRLAPPGAAPRGSALPASRPRRPAGQGRPQRGGPR